MAVPAEGGIMVGYARVSTDEQSLDMQVQALIQAGVDPKSIHTETVSGVSTRRPGRDFALKQCRRGDVFVVWRLDRVGRSLLDLLQFLQQLEARGIGFRSLRDQIDTTTLVGRVMLAMLGAFAQFERDIIAERTKAGVQRAKERGVKFGREPKMQGAVREKVEKLLAAGERVRDVAKAVNLHEMTIRRHFPRVAIDKLKRRKKR
jgi:DNA invertase Pin-like site-specific DNA recombinase